MASSVAGEAHGTCDGAASRPVRGRPLAYAATTFLSAFLLFQIQPLIGKYILPWFGGGSTVWTTTMLFFQVALIAGYAYAHFVSDRLSLRRQGLLHIALLVLAVVALPIIPSDAWKPAGGGDPTWRILVLLAATVGAPYVLLSSTAPLIQRWFAHDHPHTSPYRLYSLSNTGSLLALLTYPVLFERYLGLRAQAWLWSGGYALFVLLCGAIAWRIARRTRDAPAVAADRPVDADPGTAESVTRARVALWLALPACAAVMLLATTNQLTQDVAAIPLLWVLPLSLYLLTFILCFGNDRAYRPLRDVWLLAAGLAAGAYVLPGVSMSLQSQVTFYAFALFACCFALHGELVRLRPAARHLTAFYLMVAVGGACGGLFVALVAPAVFDGYWEYHLALVVTAVLVVVARGVDFGHGLRSAGGDSRAQRRRWLLAASAVTALAGIAALAIFLARDVRDAHRDILARSRNFYGVVRVFEFQADIPDQAAVSMQHGRILHGFQYTAPEKRALYTGYYGPRSGVGVALQYYRERSGTISVGAIGLGAGMVAAYAERGDRWLFYEINPTVDTLAERHFTYLGDARARGADVQVEIGDGRLVLERRLQRDGPMRFDVLVLDAFNSDAVPVHLLTREAIAMYWQQLQPDGVLAIHISNRHVDLSPIVRGLAAASGKEARAIVGGADEGPGVLQSVWVLVTSNRALIEAPAVAAVIAEWPANARAPRLWTDDFSNVYDLLE